MLSNCFMGILSCKKYESRRISQDLSGSIFEYMYFVGDPNITEPLVDGKVVTLPCSDGYEHLPKKTNLMIKWILENNPNIEYVFKTDDDIIFNFDRLSENFESVLSKKMDYSGNLVMVSESRSKYHFGKCDGEMNNIPVHIKGAVYCSGGGYFLSKKSAEIVVKNFPNDNTVFEDHYVGKLLNDHDIFPIHINLQNNSCFW